MQVCISKMDAHVIFSRTMTTQRMFMSILESHCAASPVSLSTRSGSVKSIYADCLAWKSFSKTRASDEIMGRNDYLWHGYHCLKAAIWKQKRRIKYFYYTDTHLGKLEGDNIAFKWNHCSLPWTARASGWFVVHTYLRSYDGPWICFWN